MLVINGDQCLLGRGHGWPDGAFSALAGFISPGETIEEGCAEVMYLNARRALPSPINCCVIGYLKRNN